MVISASAFQRVIAERDHDACTISRFAERWPPPRHRCWPADQQFVAIREAELDPRRRP